MKMKKLTGFVVLFVVLGVLLAACGGAAAGPQIKVEGAWGRPSPMIAEAGAFYMVIKNTGNEADKLVSATSDACGMVELHESFMKDDGTMGMRPVTGGAIDIPAGGQAELKVGGMHVMCMQKQTDFAAGTTIKVNLKFEKSGDMTVDAEIKDQ
jgi:copper(I)-binding protein